MKKTIISFTLALSIFVSIFSCVSFNAYAGDFSYTFINDNEICITRYAGSNAVVEIPAKIDGYSVTKIGERSFRGTSAKTIIIPEGVTEIAESAFSYLSLTSVQLPESLEIIEDEAFCSTRLTDIELPSKLKHIGVRCFVGNNLESLFIPASVTFIGKDAFIDNEKLISITVDENNKYYSSENNALYDKDKETLFLYPAANTNEVFVIPDTVKNISDFAFYHNHNNKSLKQIILNDGLESIGKNAFTYTNITEINIPDSVKSIGDYAFESCLQLQSVYIGNGLENMGASPFKNTRQLNSINVSPQNNYFSSIEGALLGNNGTELICCPPHRNSREYTVPDSVTTVKSYAICYPTFVKLNLNNVEIYEDYAVSNASFSEIILPACLNKALGIGIGSKCTVKIYNPNCDFSFSTSSSSKYNVTIYGYENSTAYDKVKNNTLSNITYNFISFESIADNPVTPPAEHQCINSVIKPTCTEQGYTEHICSICNYAYKDNYTQPTGHIYDNGIVTLKATCTKKGTKLYSCKNCNYSYSVKIASTGHKYASKVTKGSFKSAGKTVTSCSVCGAVKSKVAIARIKSVTLSKTSLIYTGKNLSKPTVTVKDSNGKRISGNNYTIQYISRSNGKAISNIKAIGQYKVKVIFKGKYSGIKELYFSLKPKKIDIKAPATGSKYVIAKWTKDKSVSGYQVVIAADSKFTKSKRVVTINKNSKTSYKFAKLKKGTKYYIKVRSYKIIKVDGRTAKMYSNYNTVKSIKCK